MSETGSSWQQELPATAEHAADARRWVDQHAKHPAATLLAAELYAAVLSTEPGVILMTVSTYGRRLRITAYGPRPITVAALSDLGGQILSALADRHGTSPDGCGLYAEITR